MKPHRIRVLLVQLPHPSYIHDNIPLSCGFLKSWIHKCGLLEKASVDILDPITCGDSGCQHLIEEIIAHNPDVLGLSLYMWNSERSMYVARMVKKQLPQLLVVIGGPEVTYDSTYLLSDLTVDIAIIGEGEIAFAKLINDISRSETSADNIRRSFKQDGQETTPIQGEPLVDINQLPSPYLLGYIDLYTYNEYPLFTMLGCPFRCSYCAWSARSHIRAFSFHRLEQELSVALEVGRRMTICLWDSAFNVSPLFYEFCNKAQEINTEGNIEFTCFLRADMVTKETAKLLKESNFKSVEIGIQSIHPPILEKIKRKSDMSRILEGIQYLKEQGILVIADSILGLPGDTPQLFEETMRFMERHELRYWFFNLSLGHGVELRYQTEQFGAKVQLLPPYYVTETDSFGKDALRSAILRRYKNYGDSDRLLDIGYPSFTSKDSYHLCSSRIKEIHDLNSIYKPINSILFKVSKDVDVYGAVSTIAKAISGKLANDLLIVCTGGPEDQTIYIQNIMPLLLHIIDANPYMAWNILVETENKSICSMIQASSIQKLNKVKNFLDARDELFPENIPEIRRRAINVLRLAKISDINSNFITNVNTIYQIDIDEHTSSSEVKTLINSRASSFLIDFKSPNDINQIKQVIKVASESRKQIFFKDRLIQRLWERTTRDFPPSIRQRYELMIDENYHLWENHLTEEGLLDIALTTWNIDAEKQGIRDLDRAIDELKPL